LKWLWGVHIWIAAALLPSPARGLNQQATMEFAMDAMTICPTQARASARLAKHSLVDPLDPDTPFDEVVITTTRSLCRLVLVAAETGGRFQREGQAHDPMAWLLAPRRMFGGSPAFEACLQREHFMRALLLHGLSLGLDADPDEIDTLLEDPTEVRTGGGRSRGRVRSRSAARLSLYTASVLSSNSGSMFQAFHASVAQSSEEFRARLRREFGAPAAERAEIRVGFDAAAPMAIALVPAPVAEVLRKVERNGASGEHRRFAVTIEHRLDA
jgi:hypothetical protein